MHHTLFSSILLLGGLAAAVPVPAEEQCLSRIICVDSINPCGIKYGGCYDECDLSAKPIAPPCPISTVKLEPLPTITKITTKVTTLKPTPTTTKKATTTKKPTPTTKKVTTKKPTTTTKKVTTKKPTPTTTKKVTTKKPTITPIKTITTLTKPTTASKCTATVSVCWDGVNECGMMYGGCFPDCKPWPTFVPPKCPTKATLTVMPTDIYTLPLTI